MWEVGRRPILAAGAFAGGLAFLGRWPVGEPAAADPVAPVGGTLANWIVIGRTGEATVRLAQFDAPGGLARAVATARLPASSVTSVDRAVAAAHALARRTTARSWAVPEASCVLGARSIESAAAGRRVGYLAWTEFA